VGPDGCAQKIKFSSDNADAIACAVSGGCSHHEEWHCAECHVPVDHNFTRSSWKRNWDAPEHWAVLMRCESSQLKSTIGLTSLKIPLWPAPPCKVDQSSTRNEGDATYRRDEIVDESRGSLHTTPAVALSYCIGRIDVLSGNAEKNGDPYKCPAKVPVRVQAHDESQTSKAGETDLRLRGAPNLTRVRVANASHKTKVRDFTDGSICLTLRFHWFADLPASNRQ